MSEMLADSPDAPFDAAAFAARQQALLADPWRLKPIPIPDFTGKVASRQTAEAMFGNRNEDPDAPMSERVSRIILMLPYARGLPDGPGVWCDSVLKQIRSLARDIGQCDSARYPGQRVHLVAKYDALVVDTEFKLEECIRLSLCADRKPFLNHAAGLNFRGQGGALQQPSRRQIHEGPPKFSASAFIARVRAAGVWIDRDVMSGGLAFRGGAALSYADRETLQDRMPDLERYLADHPELVGPPAPPAPPPPPPPLPIAQIEDEPATVEAILATAGDGQPEPVQAEDIEPIAVDNELAEPSADEAMATPASRAQPRKRRHRYAHLSTIRHS